MAKSNRSIFKIIPLHPYSVELWVLIADNPSKEVTKLCLRNKGLEIKWTDDMAAWTEDVFYKDNILTVIFSLDHCDVETIGHEVVHIKNLTYQHAGIKHDYSNDEPEAYLSGWIAGQIFDLVKGIRR